MLKDFASKRDTCAGLLLAVVGLGAVLEGMSHPVGTLTRMGAGYFPIVLGCILAGLGLFMAVFAAIGGRTDTGLLPNEPEEVFVAPDWRGVSAIVLGILAFLLVGLRFGLAPGVFACVLIAALGDRTTTWKGAIVLAVFMTAFSVGLFAYLLQIQFPVLKW